MGLVEALGVSDSQVVVSKWAEVGADQEEEALQQEAVLGKAACQEDSHLPQLLGHFHDQKGTCLLSCRNPSHHSLYTASLAWVVARKNYGPLGLHEIQTNFR